MDVIPRAFEEVADKDVETPVKEDREGKIEKVAEILGWSTYWYRVALSGSYSAQRIGRRGWLS